MKRLKAVSVSLTLLAILISASAAGENRITLVPDQGFLNETTLMAGHTYRVALHFSTAGCPDLEWRSSNSWQLFSPDDADWLYFQGGITDEFQTRIPFNEPVPYSLLTLL